MIHLDTSFLIRALVVGSGEDRQLRAWLHDEQAVGISAVGWAEFLCGPVDGALLQLAARVLQEPDPFLTEDAATAARLFNLTGRRRGTLTDCMIAAAAIRAGAALATSNRADFRRFEASGLRLMPG